VKIDPAYFVVAQMISLDRKASLTRLLSILVLERFGSKIPTFAGF